MSNVIYVMLTDAGTIFSDSSQNVAVTGKLPVAVKYTKKIQDGIRNNRLSEVAEEEAKKLLANASKEKSAIDKAHAAGESATVKKLKAELVKEKGKVNELEVSNLGLEERVAELELAQSAEDGGENPLAAQLEASQKAFNALQAKWDKNQVYIKGLQTQVKNLKDGNPAADVPDPNAEEEIKK